MKKLVQELEGLLSGVADLYPHLTEDSEILPVGSDDCFVPLEAYDGQPVIIWNDRRGSQLRRRS